MSPEKRELAWRTVRFAVVGVTCSAIYVGITLAALNMGASLMVAHIVGYAISIVCSYLGQKIFTFRVRRQHMRSGSRFLIATACVAAAQYVLVLALGYTQLSPEFIVIISALFYPAASFTVHTFWTFRTVSTAGGDGRSLRPGNK